VAIIQPAQFFACVVRSILSQRNVQIETVSIGQCAPSKTSPSALQPLGHMTSPPLSVMMNHCLQQSDNLYAEHFLLTLGARSTRSSGTTLQRGLAEIQSVLQTNFPWWNQNGLKQKDGSGVSSQGMLTPNSLTELFEGNIPYLSQQFSLSSLHLVLGALHLL
jgi:D-alanyl-D-alanine carboxypeptidase